MVFVQTTARGVILRIRVQPRSTKSGITGTIGDRLKVCVNAPAAEGAANKACRDLLARLFGVSKGRVEIVSGARSREKRVLLKDFDEASALSRLSEILDEPAAGAGPEKVSWRKGKTDCSISGRRSMRQGPQ